MEKRIEEFKAENKERIDILISKNIEGLSRSFAKKLIEEGLVFVNDIPVKKPSTKVEKGEKITVIIPEPEKETLEAEEGDIEIIHEDDDIAVIVKPCGMVVHPSPGHKKGTLVNVLLGKLKNLSSVGGKERPGIVHRLDRETAGLMVVAKNDMSHKNLSEQFKYRKTDKEYIALVKGVVREDHGIIDVPIGRHIKDRKKFSIYTAKPRSAKTEFWVKERFYKTETTLLRIKIYTGRTHQIRVHLSHLGFPVVGDKLYGFKPSSLPEDINSLLGKGCIMLNSVKLGFNHPRSCERMEFEIEGTRPFTDVIGLIRKIES